MNIRSFRDLQVYQLGKEAAKEIQERTKKFPFEERFNLTDQIRKSSRAVCACIAEAWRKRRYSKNFVSKLNEAESEAEETRVWIEFASDYEYMDKTVADALDSKYESILAKLVVMIKNPQHRTIR